MMNPDRQVPQIDYGALEAKVVAQQDGVLANGLSVTQAARVRSILRRLEYELTASDHRQRLAVYRPRTSRDNYAVKVEGGLGRYPEYVVIGSHQYLEAAPSYWREAR